MTISATAAPRFLPRSASPRAARPLPPVTGPNPCMLQDVKRGDPMLVSTKMEDKSPMLMVVAEDEHEMPLREDVEGEVLEHQHRMAGRNLAKNVLETLEAHREAAITASRRNHVGGERSFLA